MNSLKKINKDFLEGFISTLDVFKNKETILHLKMALFEWNKEKQWNKICESYALNYEDKGFCFFTFTKRMPRHCTLRHIVVLEEYRKCGIASILINKMKDTMNENYVPLLRFYVNKPAVEFYKKLGFKFIGENKSGMPFVFCKVKSYESVLDKVQLKKLSKIY